MSDDAVALDLVGRFSVAMAEATAAWLQQELGDDPQAPLCEVRVSSAGVTGYDTAARETWDALLRAVGHRIGRVVVSGAGPMVAMGVTVMCMSAGVACDVDES